MRFCRILQEVFLMDIGIIQIKRSVVFPEHAFFFDANKAVTLIYGPQFWYFLMAVQPQRRDASVHTQLFCICK